MTRLRDEDERLLRGQGQYTDDLRFSDEACMVVVRSSVAAARIVGIDTDAARSLPGVIGIYTAADLDARGLGKFLPKLRFDRPDGSPMIVPPFDVLARDAVRYVGDPVAFVIADTVHQARDAAEQVFVDYQETPPVSDVAAAVSDGAPEVWKAIPDNISFRMELGDSSSVESAFAAADHVIEHTFRISRVAVSSIEPRMAIARYDDGEGRYTLYTGTQTPHRLRDMLAGDILDIEPDGLRVVCPDVGGSFGMKNSPFPEQAMALWAARETGRTVRWVSSRSEAFLADSHARDNLTTIALALDEKGVFKAIRVKTLANLGA